MFLSNPRASHGPADDFWFQPLSGGAFSGAGVHVSPDTAFQFSTVYKCIKVISETLSILPIHFFETLPADRRRRLTDHPVAKLLSNRPNAWQTPMQFRAMMEAHRSLRGNAYALIVYDQGTPSQLMPWHPDRVTVTINTDGIPLYTLKNLHGQTVHENLLPGEVLHLTGLTLNGVMGISPIEAEREAIGAGIAARDHGSKFWRNGARPPFWIKVPYAFKTAEDRGKFRDEWQSMYGGVNLGRPAVLDRDMEIKELGVSNSDAEWLDARKYSDLDICGLWRVPPHKIGLLDRATWGNIEQQNIEFVTDCLLPLAISWEQTITRDLLGEDEPIFAEIITEVLLRGDTQTRYDAYGKAIKDGWLTRNEVRRFENEEPLAGLDEPLQPLNMTTAVPVTAPNGPKKA